MCQPQCMVLLNMFLIKFECTTFIVFFFLLRKCAVYLYMCTVYIRDVLVGDNYFNALADSMKIG